MNITLIGHGRLGKLLSQYLEKDFSLNILGIQKSKSDLEKLKNSQCVILCVPISEMPNILSEIKDYLQPKTIVMDTCSVKEWPIEQMKKILPENIQILGTHPMFGPDSVKDTLFGTKLVLCPERIETSSLSELISYFKNHGIKTICTSAPEHDRQMSSSLLLSHFIGKGLLNFGAQEQEIDTKGYRRLLRILNTVQNDSDTLFRDMFRYNKYAEETLENFLSSLKDAQKVIRE